MSFKIDIATNPIRELDSLVSRSIYGYGVSMNYLWRIDMIDVNGVSIASGTTGFCQKSWTEYSCSLNGSITYNHPANNWNDGIYYFRLFEISLPTANIGYVMQSSPISILNASGKIVPSTSTSTTRPANESWGTPDMPNSISHSTSLLDKWVGTMGLGVNNQTRFLFAVVVIMLFIMMAGIATRNNVVAMAAGFMPFAFFSAISLDADARAAGIEFIPKWMIVLFIILIALSVRIFR